MVRDWDDELFTMESKLHEVKTLLDELSDEQGASLLRIKPVITILQISCDFIVANLTVIRNQLTE